MSRRYIRKATNGEGVSPDPVPRRLRQLLVLNTFEASFRHVTVPASSFIGVRLGYAKVVHLDLYAQIA